MNEGEVAATATRYLLGRNAQQLARPFTDKGQGSRLIVLATKHHSRECREEREVVRGGRLRSRHVHPSARAAMLRLAASATGTAHPPPDKPWRSRQGRLQRTNTLYSWSACAPRGAQ